MRSTPAGPRVWAWAAATVFFVGFAIVYMLVPPGRTLGAVIAALFPIAPGVAALTALWAHREAHGKRARLWRLVSISMAAFWLGTSFRAINVLRTGAFPTVGSFEDIMFFVGFVALIPVALLLTDPFEVIALRKVRSMLDLMGIVFFVLGVTLLLILGPLGAVVSDRPLASSLVFAFYPTAGIALVLYLLAFKRSAWRSADVLIVSGLSAGAIGVTLAVARISQYRSGAVASALPDIMLTAGFVLIAMAGLHAATQSEPIAVGETPEMDLPRWPGIVAMAAGLLGIPAAILMAPLIEDALVRTLVAGCAAMLALVIVARSAIVTLENRQLAARSIWDPLTEVFNHRYFRTRLAEESFEAMQLGTELTVCVIDIDSFDAFNRAYGYREGDRRLTELGRTLAKAASGGGLAFRIGGDDFALLLPGRSKAEARSECARIALEAQSIRTERLPAPTLSIGIASLPTDTADPESLARLAAGAAYWASSNGGDDIVAFDPDIVGALDSRQHVVQLEQQSHDRLVEALAAAVDARDPYTRNHSTNVARLTEALARAVGLSEDRVHLIASAALLHDVGKIGIPDAILGKPSSLSDQEYQHIKEHPELGAGILKATNKREILPWIRHHHEWWDGTGYPSGLEGNEIPYEARLLAVCDAYDAMTSDRPYKPGRTVSEAVDELRRCSGTQFDREVVEAFIDTLVSTWPETHMGIDSAVPEVSDVADGLEPARHGADLGADASDVDVDRT